VLLPFLTLADLAAADRVRGLCVILLPAAPESRDSDEDERDECAAEERCEARFHDDSSLA
jgi:hypothetical protein